MILIHSQFWNSKENIEASFASLLNFAETVNLRKETGLVPFFPCWLLGDVIGAVIFIPPCNLYFSYSEN